MSHDLYTEQKGLSYEEALFEAQRCLNCRHKPCMEGCIAHNDIPAMIMAFIEGKGEEAKAISESKPVFLKFVDGFVIKKCNVKRSVSE